MKRILAILLLLCIGCKQEENKPKIEIYLLKHPVASTEGIPYIDSEEYKLEGGEYDPAWLEIARYDTIYQQILHGGKFVASVSDLQDHPFINNEEIKYFNPTHHCIILDERAESRIQKLLPAASKPQFAITVNKKPLFFGYFWTTMVSSTPYSFYIYDDESYNFKDKEGEKTFKIEFRYAEFSGKSDSSIRPSYPPELIEAFRSSGRLLE